MATFTRRAGMDSKAGAIGSAVSVVISVPFSSFYHQDQNSTRTNRINRRNTISYRRRVPADILALPVISGRSAWDLLSSSVTTTKLRWGSPLVGIVATGEM